MKFIDLFAGIGGFRYGLERTNKQDDGAHQEARAIIAKVARGASPFE